MIRRGLAWGTRTLPVVLAAAAVWSLMAWSHEGPAPGASAGPSLVVLDDQGDEVIGTVALALITVVVGGFALVGSVAAASVGVVPSGSRRARPPPAR